MRAGMFKTWLVIALGFTGSAQAFATQEAAPPIVAVDEAEMSPDDADVARAGPLMDAGKFDDAILIFDAVLKRSPRHGNALANRALAFGWTNRLVEAERDLHAAEDVIPNAAILHRIRAVIADRRSDDEMLIAETTKALAMEPGNIFALRFRANAYQRANREADAMADADAYIKAHADDPDAYVFKANLAIRQQKRPAALIEASRLEQLFPKDAYAIAASARIFDRLGDREKALQLITEAIVIDPEYYYYHYLRAGMRRWDDFTGRMADLETAIAFDPNNANTLTQLGVIEFKRRHWSQSIAYFTKVLEKEPRDYGVMAYRAMAHLSAGDRTAATRDFDAAMLASSGADDFSLICWALGVEGQALDWATTACDKAVGLKEDKSEYRSNRGLVRLRLGQLQSALDDFDAAVATDDRYASNYYGRAIVRQRTGNIEGAKADRERALAIDPTIAESYEEYGLSIEL